VSALFLVADMHGLCNVESSTHLRLSPTQFNMKNTLRNALIWNDSTVYATRDNLKVLIEFCVISLQSLWFVFALQSIVCVSYDVS
jgi:hypothetical protein